MRSFILMSIQVGISASILLGCAPPGSHKGVGSSGGNATSGAGARSSQVIGGEYGYSTNGDSRVNQYIDANKPPNPDTTTPQQQPPPAATPTTPVVQDTLGSEIVDIQFDRYGKNNSLERFGNDHVVITVYLSDQAEPLVFTAPVEKSSTRSVIQTDSGAYSFSGYLDDNFPVETLGDFDLIKTGTTKTETTKLLFRAYAANLDVKIKGEGNVSAISPARVQALSMQKGVYGWSKNWSILSKTGIERAFYIMDVVKLQKAKRGASQDPMGEQVILSLHGDTVGNDPNPQTVEVTKSQTPAQATLTKTEDNTGLRDFQIAIPDPRSTQTVQVQVTAKPDLRAQMAQIESSAPTQPALPNTPPNVDTTAPMAPRQPAPTGPTPMAPLQHPVSPSTMPLPTLSRPTLPARPPQLPSVRPPAIPAPMAPTTPVTAPRAMAMPPSMSQTPAAVPTPAKRPVVNIPGTPPQVRLPTPAPTPAPAPLPAPVPATPQLAPTTPTASTELRPMARPPGLKDVTPEPATLTPVSPVVTLPGDGPYMAVKAISPGAKVSAGRVRELAIQGMCMSDTRGSRQVSEGKCKTLWNAITSPGAPAAGVLDSIGTPADIHTYCPNYESIIAGNKTKKALVYMALLSAVAWQEYAWGYPARPNRYGIFQLAFDIGQNYDASTCQNINVSNHNQNIKCGAYVALYNLKQGNRISSSNLGNFAMSHYFGSLQSGRSEQIRIAGKVKAYCQALARTAL